MPKVGMEPERRAALVSAVIDEIGEARSLDVTVSRIARRAGMSSGLAHHYFGSKDQMLIAAMRHILAVYSERVRAGLAAAEGPRARLEAVIRANFEDHVFDRRKTSAWLSFYALAQGGGEAGRLMRLYQARLYSNLLHGLRPLVPHPEDTARVLGALIDGVYLRAALRAEGTPPDAVRDILATLDALLATDAPMGRP